MKGSELTRLIAGHVFLHACMAGTRMAAPLPIEPAPLTRTLKEGDIVDLGDRQFKVADLGRLLELELDGRVEPVDPVLELSDEDDPPADLGPATPVERHRHGPDDAH